MKNILKSLLVWVLIIPLAILNGGFREKILMPWFGEQFALPISGILLCILIFLVTVLLLHKLVKGGNKTYWAIGSVWIFLTIGIEFIIGSIMNNPIEEMLAAYDITTGNLWLLVVIFTGFAPWLSAKIRKII
ncbi:hypothetical protein JGH11_19490 [Dysgonomonas sp. Marseille-P4677]|uniref:hypothetical protein n=1 Tax=Dysgonomonas sp. Marseille-P4677 TaxID=2364790 RepID=UPI001913151D|nr:hypothetical protein [Dysgonomonas sp. Marseille-P4677]MBK5723055.1 hypothetical protein [Dysgonomonas sp. Marseille-P4677]